RLVGACAAPGATGRSAGAAAPSSPAFAPGRLRDVHLVARDIRAHRQVVDDAAHARALPGVIPRVARLHEVVDLAREGHHAILDVDLDAVRVDPGVLVHVREHRVPDLVVAHAALGLAELVEVAAGAGPAVGRCVAGADVGVALDVLRAGERALVVLLAVAGGAETARAPRLPLVAAHVLLVVAREGGPGLVAHPAGL